MFANGHFYGESRTAGSAGKRWTVARLQRTEANVQLSLAEVSGGCLASGFAVNLFLELRQEKGLSIDQ